MTRKAASSTNAAAMPTSRKDGTYSVIPRMWAVTPRLTSCCIADAADNIQHL
jgi:NAD(P)H-nitrite reductase large subunit